MTSARKMAFVLESLESADMSINSICSDFGNQRTSLFSNRGRGEFVRNELRCMGLFPCVPLVVLYQSLRGRSCTISKSHKIHRQCLMLVSFPPRNWVGCYLPLLPAWVPMPASNFFASLKIARFYAHMFLPVYAHVCSTDPSCSLMLVNLSYPILSYYFPTTFGWCPHEESPSTTLSDSFTHTHTVTLTFKRKKIHSQTRSTSSHSHSTHHTHTQKKIFIRQ